MARRFLPATPEKLTDAAQEIQERQVILASTSIASVQYDFISDEVTINFMDGSRYVYYDVDLDTYVGLVRAGSKGQYFNENIRNNFSYQRV